MTYGDLKRDLKGLINRKDFSDEQAGGYINRTIDRLNRNLRLSFMERLSVYSIADETGDILVPSDYLEMIEVFTDSQPISQLSIARFLTLSDELGVPAGFIKTAHQISFRPRPLGGTTIRMHYYGAEPHLVSDEDENTWSVTAHDALLYGAAQDAADYFEDQRVDRYSARFAAAVEELKVQGDRELMMSASRVMPSANLEG